MTRDVVAVWYERLRQLRWSNWLFYATIGLFVIETSFIAIRSAYPMAYDESYHVGLIQFFSHHLNPVITQQDPSTFVFGNIVHSPSWLYHWLLSFPDRLLALTGNQRFEVVGLRCINIGIAVASLLVLRRLLRQFKLSKALQTFVVFLVAMTPTFAILAAQVNYDTLVVFASLLSASLTLTAVEQLRAGKPSALTFAGLLLTVLFGSMVKYSFVPIAVGVAIIIIVVSLRAPKAFSSLWNELEKDFQSVRSWLQIVVVAAIIAGVSLFSLFYVQNMVRYHNPVPQCEQVLNVPACQQYGAWARNHALAQERSSVARLENPAIYTYHWLKTCWYQLYGVIKPWGDMVRVSKVFYGFLIVTTGIAGIVTIIHVRKLLSSYPQLILTTTLGVVYAFVLWARNFNDYRHLGVAIAIQGRYIIPVVAFFYLILVLGVHVAMPTSLQWQRFKHIATALIVTMLVVFGGTTLYVRAILPYYSWGHVAIPE